MSDNEGVNSNEGNKPSEVIGLFNLYYDTDSENYWEAIDDEDNESSEEIVSFASQKANDNISIGSSGGTTSIAFLKDQSHINKKFKSSYPKPKQLRPLKYTFAGCEMEYYVSNDEQDTSNFRHEESSDDDSEDSELDVPKSPVNLADDSLSNTQDIKTIQNIIYDSLFEYWYKPKMIGLLASLLDPRLKTLSCWDEETQERAKAELIHQFVTLVSSNSEQTTSMHINSKNYNNIRHSHLHSLIFGVSTTNNTTPGPLDELEHYLDL
ncbi:31892_t:CDS:2, partial [Gigaspora margarita]